MLRRFLFLAAAAVALMTSALAETATAEQQHGFVQRIYEDEEGRHKYTVFVPYSYTPEKKWPIILFLHGADERGDDGQRQLQVGLGPLVEARQKTFPFLVVFPQAKRRPKQRLLETWSPDSPDGRRALAIFDQVESEYSVDKEREILTGWSMGGYGVWKLGAAQPDRWDALVPLAGGGDPALAEKLVDVPIWAFHGARDRVVPPSESRRMIDALRRAGGKARYTELAEEDHNVWKTVYASDELYRWTIHHDVTDVTEVPLRVKPDGRPLLAENTTAPFVPALTIRRALYLRLGNDALEAISYGLPGMVPPDLLSGSIADISDTTTTAGRTFWVTFSGVRYDGELARAYIQATADRRLRIWLGLQNVRLTIGTTYVQGEGRSAVAGPIFIVIGHRRPVWLTVDTELDVQNRKLRLRLAKTWFQIADDNWYVTAPQWVSTRGLGMTRRRVSQGLVSGLYGSKSRIEREVRVVVPKMLETLEEKLNSQFETAQVSELVSGFWPLPVYRPRVRLFPESISTDADGLSLLVGITAAAIHPEAAPKTPKIVDTIGARISDVPTSRDLRIAMTGEALQPLTDLLIQADVARIHVEETPHGGFAPFADYQALLAALPDLKQYGPDVEIWAELILAEPLRIADANPSESEAAEILIEAPKVLISTALREGPDSEWQPYAEFDISVSQRARLELRMPSFRSRLFEMKWVGPAEIQVEGRFASEYKPQNPEINLDRVAEMFRHGWNHWTHSGPAAERHIPDLAFGRSRLRASQIGWKAPFVFAAFSAAGIRLTNASQQPLTYQIKAPHSGWGGPYTLQPGKSHTYPVPYWMLFRRRVDDRYRLFTLPAGSHSEFREPRTGGPPQLFQAREP